MRTDGDLIRFDFINADGQLDSKMLTHDEMRQRYSDLLRRAAPASAASDPVPQGWEVTHAEPWSSLTPEAQQQHRISVKRLSPPFCGKDGIRQWSGPTLSAAFDSACAALNLPPVVASAAAPAAEPEGVSGAIRFGQLLSGEHFCFSREGRTFKRDRAGFRALPNDDNGRWFPLAMDTPVYRLAAPTNADGNPDSKMLTHDEMRQPYADDCAQAAKPSTSPMCERKTNDIMQRDGYLKTGYVLRLEDPNARICVSEGGAVSWFTPEQWNWLMFNRDHVEFRWPKPATPATPTNWQDSDRLEFMIANPGAYVCSAHNHETDKLEYGFYDPKGVTPRQWCATPRAAIDAAMAAADKKPERQV